MRLEWKNHWMHKEWQPLAATSLEQAKGELLAMMPHSEDGTVIRDADTGDTWTFIPPREPALNFGDF